MDEQDSVKAGKDKKYYQCEARENLRKYRLEYGCGETSKISENNKPKVGDKVWYRAINPQEGKLEPKWQEKGVIVETKLNSYKVRLEDDRTIVASRNHVKSLKEEVAQDSKDVDMSISSIGLMDLICLLYK